MIDYKKLSSDEIVALTTINCCANALRDNAPKLARRLKSSGLEENLTKAADLVAAVVEYIVEGAPDPDQRTMILRRMGSLQLQFGHTRKHPEELVMMDMGDAQTLLAPLFDHCDIDCPFDALALIRQTDASYRQLSKALCGMENATLEELLQGASQLKSELALAVLQRDAAVDALGKSHPCESCKHFDCQWDEPPCDSCLHSDPVDNFTSNFEWRGVCPENTEEQANE